MNVVASDVFPFRLQWNSHDLAGAVPLRLFELCDFTIEDREAASANAASLVRRMCRERNYLPAAGMTTRFRIHG